LRRAFCLPLSAGRTASAPCCRLAATLPLGARASALTSSLRFLAGRSSSALRPLIFVGWSVCEVKWEDFDEAV
jgi:hypothetical protein